MDKLGDFLLGLNGANQGVYVGDCAGLLRGLPDESVTAVLCDPPYLLEFMGKEGDKPHKIRYAEDADFAQRVDALAEMLGLATWEAAAILWHKGIWEQVCRVLKPGGVVLAFGGTRTYDLMVMGMRAGGLEVYDSISHLQGGGNGSLTDGPLLWVYGSGFPKSHSISKAIDKAAGVGGENKSVFLDCTKDLDNTIQSVRYKKCTECGRMLFSPDPCACDWRKAVPSTEPAQTWDGWGTALKPAVEFVALARKPRGKLTYAECAEHGAGALWVDGCRIETNEIKTELYPAYKGQGAVYGEYDTTLRHNGNGTSNPQGRWPANVILSHHPDCVRVGIKRVKGLGNAVRRHGRIGWINRNGEKSPPLPDMGYTAPDGLETVEAWECVEGCPVKMLDEMSGKSGSQWHLSDGQGTFEAWRQLEGRTDQPNGKDYQLVRTYGDRGGASRFFKQIEPDQPTRFLYTAKASRGEREAGLEGLPEARVARMGHGHDEPDGLTQAHISSCFNPHPTVKPLALTEYLARLIRPPEEYLDDAVVLVPFCGTGSEIIGAIKAGWRNWLGIEISEEYAEIARARIAYWRERTAQTQPPLPHFNVSQQELGF